VFEISSSSLSLKSFIVTFVAFEGDTLGCFFLKFLFLHWDFHVWSDFFSWRFQYSVPF
jgi:hypothetical protein